LVNAAYAGRNDPSKQFNVNDWNADNGNDNVGAVPAVVSSFKRFNLVLIFAWWIVSNHQASYLAVIEKYIQDQGRVEDLKQLKLFEL